MATAKNTRPGKAVTSEPRHRIFGMPFARIYPAWLSKVERKGRSRKELDQSPAFNPKARLITGTVCGVRVEEIAEPSMRRLRQLDKLVDELARGKSMREVLRDDP